MDAGERWKGKILYSTNSWVKCFINQKYFGDKHYVWCSPYFDPSQLGLHSHGSLIPDTSNPHKIYQDLYRASKKAIDKHNDKINSSRSKLLARYALMETAGQISASDASEISYILNDNNPNHWRPILYIIPVVNMDPARIKLVPMAERAGIGEEFIIEDLMGDEADMIEFHVA